MSQHNINHLLQQVDLISKKYEQIEELTGENFNVFDILGVRSNELSHSSFICYLLDVKGKHGQKDLFLKLFIKQLENRFTGDKAQVLNKFQTERSHSITEMSLGNKSKDVSNGGRIDIIIKDGTDNIIIENKIYASDQEKQLVRYSNYDRNAPLIYLTLGDEMPSKDSISHEQEVLKENADFISISYKNDIKNWLQECIKIVYDKPLIRETLRQYVFLINELTNQSNNKIMSKEIINILTKDENSFDSFQKIINVQNEVYIKITEKLKDQIQNFDLEVSLEVFNLSSEMYTSFQFGNSKLKSSNLIISFGFEKNNFNEFDFGFTYINEKENRFSSEKVKLLQEIYKSKFGEVASSNSFPAYSGFHKYRNWSNDYVKSFGDILNGQMAIEIKEVIIKLLDVFEEFQAVNF